MAKGIACMGVAVLTLVVLGYSEFAAMWAGGYMLLRGILAACWPEQWGR